MVFEKCKEITREIKIIPTKQVGKVGNVFYISLSIRGFSQYKTKVRYIFVFGMMSRVALKNVYKLRVYGG